MDSLTKSCSIQCWVWVKFGLNSSATIDFPIFYGFSGGSDVPLYSFRKLMSSLSEIRVLISEFHLSHANGEIIGLLTQWPCL